MRHSCLDIELANSTVSETRSLRWPVSLSAYHSIDEALTKAFFDGSNLEVQKLLQTPPLLATIKETSTFAVRLLTRVLELQSLRNQGDNLSGLKVGLSAAGYDLPYLKALLGDNTGYDLSDHMSELWRSPSLKTSARQKLGQYYRYYRKKYVDGAVTNLPPLALQFIEKRQLHTATVTSSDRHWSRKSWGVNDVKFGEWAASSLLQAWQSNQPLDGDLKEAIYIQLSHLIAAVACNMNRQWKRFCQSPILSPGEHLYSGTPKYYTALLSAYYQHTGREVTRFSHGGERGLFFDKHWGLTEYPYCDRYVFHGKGEADFMQARLHENPLFANSILKSPDISSVPSKQHFSILSRSQTIRKKAQQKAGKKVLFVCSSIIAESQMVSPTFKLGNMLTIEFHRWVMDILIKAGYEVYIKPHPKGVQGQYGNEAYLGDLASGVVKERLTPEVVNEFDCLLFDFAGSAFMDCLMMEKGVVLLDTGLRQFTEGARTLLNKRAHCVTSCQHDHNLMRVVPEHLYDAIDAVSARSWLEEAENFALSYFG